MGCRFPGAPDLKAFESLLLEGRCSIEELPEDRFNQARYYDPDPAAPGKSYSRIGACLDDVTVDPGRYRLSDEELRAADTVHLWSLEVASATFAHAGVDPFSLEGKDVGVLLGHSRGGMRHSDLSLTTAIEALLREVGDLESFRDLPPDLREQVRAEAVRGVRDTYPPVPTNGQPAFRASGTAGLVARAFGLRGRHLVVDAACASSLAAIDIAARALRQGRLDLALAGGAAFTSPHSMVLFSRSQALSAEGSYPFDARANGFVASDGVGMVLLARLDYAVARGLRIYGVLHGVGSSCDGRGKGLWAPNPKGQLQALRNAYANFGVDPSTVGYIEAHGTSTSLGDASEAEALTEFFRDKLPAGRRIPIGSIKSNLGHSREAAGIAGLLKVLVAFQREVIPATIGIERPTPHVDWEASPLRLVREPIPWTRTAEPRVAGVDSFGIGGLNYHAIVEEAPAPERLAELLSGTDASGPAEEREPIAIVGIGCIVPGARGPREFWQALLDGRISVAELPPSRWPAEIFYRPADPGPYGTRARHGGFIADFQPDWKRYRLPPALVRNIDPLQLMLLECAVDAFADAGIDLPAADRSRIGVTVGAMFGSDYALEIGLAIRAPEVVEFFQRAARGAGIEEERIDQAASELLARLRARLPVLNEDTSASASSSPLASRIASTLDLHGGVCAIDSSYASSIVALEAACEALRAGHIDAIVWASGDRGLSWMRYVDATRMGILSANSSGGPFESGASGLVLGEGAVACILKRESDARAAGDRIYATIHGVGSASGFEREAIPLAPRVRPAEALSSAIQRAQCASPAPLSFVETLPTGTDEGDRAALEIVGSLAQPGTPLLVGSLTANVGHTQGASGALGVIKTALALHYGEVPATPIVRPSDTIPSGITVTLEPVRLSASDGPLRAAVTALVPDGTSYHVVLGAPGPAASAAPAARAPIVVRAATRAQLGSLLDELSGRAAELVAGTEIGSGPVSAALRSGQGVRDRVGVARKALSSPNPSVMLSAAGVAVTDFALSRETCFLFPGQGSQYPGMLRDVAEAYPAARRRLEEIDAILVRSGQLPLSTVMWERTDILNEVLWTQMSALGGDLMMLEVARVHELEPSVVTGHSYGDYPALVAAGAWSLEQVVEMTVVRCENLLRAGSRGGMVAVFASRETVAGLLADLPGYAAQSNVNAPDEVIVSGEEQALEVLLERCRFAGVNALRLPVPMPFHSELLRPAAEIVAGVVANLPFERPRIPFLTSSGAKFIAEPHELRRALVDQFTLPVDFIAQIEAAWAAGCRRFVEIGPGNLLSRLALRILQGRPAVVVSLNEKKLPAIDAIEFALAALRAHDAPAGTRSPLSTGEVGATPPSSERTRGAIRFFDVTVKRGPRREAPSPRPAASAPAAASAHTAVEERLVDLVCEISGYPRELVDLDADLEADLGIDTVKQAQVLGRVRSLYDLPTDESMAIRDLPTLRRLAAWVERAAGGTETLTATATPRAEAPARQEPVTPESRPLDPAPAAKLDLPRLASKPGASLRYVLRTESRERPAGPPDSWRPARVVLLGGGAFAEALRSKLAARGVAVEAVEVESPMLEERLTADPLPDLCVLAGVERIGRSAPGVQPLLASWSAERAALVANPYRAVQRWMRAVSDSGTASPPTLSAVTALGGALGLWNTVDGHPEGGSVLGLFRGLRREFPAVRSKVLDIEPSCSPAEAAQALIDDLDSGDAVPEIGLLRGRRLVAALHPATARLDAGRLEELRSFPSVLLTGGARGITAEIAVRLAAAGVRRLHLVGSTALPPEVESWRGLGAEEFEMLRLQVLRNLRAERGTVSPVEWDAACEPMEKAVEVDRNLARIRQAGAEVEYHAADIADDDALAAVLERIRAAEGGIQAIVHGAGFQISRGFLSRTGEELESTLRPKLDGCVNLMRLTADDPLRLFVAFGSVSGRFGGLGQADYSLASEMLARLVGTFAAERPECRAMTISWPAWGEVGMAVHRRTRHMLEARGRTFMSVEEGGDHFLREILAASPEIEVTVGADVAALAPLSEPAPALVERRALAATLPLADAVVEAGENRTTVECHVDADRDPFLLQHRQGRTGITPAVVLLEFLAESACLAKGSLPAVLEDVSIETGVKLSETRRLTIRGTGSVSGDGVDVELSAHQVGRRGRILSLDQRRVKGTARFGDLRPARPIAWTEPPAELIEAQYRDTSRHFQGPEGWFHGTDLRTLERSTMLDGPLHWGIVRARPASNLRPWGGDGWIIPAPALDGCLAVCVGVVRGKLKADGLPSIFGRLWIGRPPKDDESCLVIARELGYEEREVRFDFTLFGEDREPILIVEDYAVRTFGAIASAGMEQSA